MRHLSTLVLLVCAAACQPPGGDPDPDVGGPTSDWPHVGVGSNGTSATGAPVSPADSQNPNAATPGSSGAGTVGGTSSGTTGASAPGATTPSTAGAGATGSTPVLSADAGVASADGGAGGMSGTADAGTGAGQGDAALSDTGVPEAGLPDAAAGDAGCTQASTPDASMCPGYACRTTLQQLRASMDHGGACTSNEALAVACAGVATNAALQCTQDSVFSVNLSSTVSACLKRDPRLAQLGSACLDCYTDEALCMLSRCFAACTVTSGSACQSCRRQQCSGPLAACTGLPTPP